MIRALITNWKLKKKRKHKTLQTDDDEKLCVCFNIRFITTISERTN